MYGLGAISDKDTKCSIQRCQIITGRRMEKAVWKAAVNREVNNCVYNWTSDRITGRFATANEVKSVTSHEVINNNTTVENFFDTEPFKKWCTYIHKWFENGWVNSGAASDTESYYSYIKSGQAFSFFSDYGHPLSVVELVDTVWVHENGEITVDFNFADEYQRILDYNRIDRKSTRLNSSH